MRVFVSSPSEAIAPPILAYAELRIFAALAPYPDVQGARVVLRQDRGDGGVRCSVNIHFVSEASATTRARGPHAAATIDRAAARVGRMMRRRSPP